MSSEIRGGRYVAPFEPLYDADGVQVHSGQDQLGRELPDPVPMAPPVGYRAPPTLADMIRRMVRSEAMLMASEAEEFDTFEEAEDFDIEDDPVDPRTPYEAVFDPPQPAADAAKPKEGTDVPGATELPAEPSGGNGTDHSSGAGHSDPEGATAGSAK